MAVEKNVKNAYDVYRTLCQMLDDLKLKYSREDDEIGRAHV